ncbi:MAG: hypothetical protein VW378_04860 [bacterium]
MRPDNIRSIVNAVQRRGIDPSQLNASREIVRLVEDAMLMGKPIKACQPKTKGGRRVTPWISNYFPRSPVFKDDTDVVERDDPFFNALLSNNHEEVEDLLVDADANEGLAVLFNHVVLESIDEPMLNILVNANGVNVDLVMACITSKVLSKLEILLGNFEEYEDEDKQHIANACQEILSPQEIGEIDNLNAYIKGQREADSLGDQLRYLTTIS